MKNFSSSHARLAVIVLASMQATSVAQAKDDDDEVKLDQIVVTATRMPALIRDEPLHVEAVPTEEIEENLTVQPGNVSTLLSELPGVRLQSSTPGLGGVGLQLRGLPRRHTLVLSDGLPLLGAEPDAFGLLQTPPLDLARVEVIKGSVSALYGGSAIGGALNLVSQSPGSESQLMANANSRGGRDIVAFLTEKNSSRWSGTLTVGAHDQSREEIGGEGWADLPGFRRYTLRPRVWWNFAAARSIYLTAGFTDENREGGTLPGRVLPGGASFTESLHTRRTDGGIVSQWTLANGLANSGRLSITSTRMDRIFGSQRVYSGQSTIFAEEVISGNAHGHAWIAGLAFQHATLVANVSGVGYVYNVPAVFVQDEFAITRAVTVAGSARMDAHNIYGTFLSPRLSVLLHVPESEWSMRASVGSGFAAPTSFVDDVEATSLGSLLPLRGLRAERATTASLDAKWADKGWDINASLFTAEIRNPLESRAAPGQKLEIVSAIGPLRAPGVEALIHYTFESLQLIASWTYLDVSESASSGGREEAPSIPRHTGELGAIVESEKRGRIGIEIGYTGKQTLKDDPYRNESEPYVELNVLGEIRFGGIALFFNAINLTDVRQTHFNSLVRPTLGPGGSPITNVWAPLTGRTFNLGIRAEL